MQQHDETVIDGIVVLLTNRGLENIDVMTTNIGFDLHLTLAAGKPGFLCWDEMLFHPAGDRLGEVPAGFTAHQSNRGSRIDFHCSCSSRLASVSINS